MTTDAGSDLSTMVAQHLPYLRRYARALTGSQQSGDLYAAATLEAILEDSGVFERNLGSKVALFRAFHMIWASAGSPVSESETAIEARAQKHLERLTQNTREALLLFTIEEFDRDEIATIMDTDTAEVDGLIQIAHKEMEESVAGRVLVIEDEAIIAMDIESIVSALGHEVIGVARTRDGAVSMGKKEEPDLILADIQLADNSSGIDAVNDLLAHFGNIPVCRGDSSF